MTQQAIPVAPLEAFYFRDFQNSHIPEILDEIYLKRIYEPYLNGKRNLIIADFGANIGLASYYFKDYAKRVYAVEPSRQHQEAIEATIRQNKISNIVVCPYAISNKSGKEKFYHHPNSTMFSLSDVVNNKQDFEEVDTITIAEFFETNKIDKIDLLKLDVEGTEGELIMSDGFKQYAPKIKVIVGEYHDWASMNKTMFKRTFEELGFIFRWNYSTHASVFSAVRV